MGSCQASEGAAPARERRVRVEIWSASSTSGSVEPEVDSEPALVFIDRRASGDQWTDCLTMTLSEAAELARELLEAIPMSQQLAKAEV